MNHIDVNINEVKVTLSGKKDIIEKEKAVIEKLELTGNESKDRLILQKCIDGDNLKSDISYCGSSIYPFEKTVKQYRRLQKTGSLDNMTEYMYNFFTLACDDIAHYNIYVYKDYNDYSIVKLENEVLKNSWTSERFSDIDRIFKEIKIGKYFEDREKININKISLKTLKSIIKECGWEISINSDGTLKVYKNMIYDIEYSFNVIVLDNSISNIVQEIQNEKNSFDANEYTENMVSNRNDMESKLKISQIVSLSNIIKQSLTKLYDDVLYKSRVIAEETKDISPEETKENYKGQQISLFANNDTKSSSNTAFNYATEDYNDLEICG